MSGPEPPGIQHRQATILSNRILADQQGLLRIVVPDLAATAQPGQFVHLLCHASLTLPRPFSILDANPTTGTLDLLYRVVGQGTAHMATWRTGDAVSLAGPTGRPFSPIPPATPVLMLAGGVGLAPLDFLARRANAAGARVTLLLGTESTPPFATIPAQHPISTHLPGATIPDATHPPGATTQDTALLALRHLEQLGVVSRLAAGRPTPGFYRGFVTDLARVILESMDPASRADVRVLACGPPAMLAATARLLKHFNLSGEVSLEARMACGFGGCAGCAVPILGAGGEMNTGGIVPMPGQGNEMNHFNEIQEKSNAWHYKRVCIDGPVFNAAHVAWDHFQ
ncbi:MAG: dihydroorotate dehydrogenase electron transfer subunit [Magnetococcus sp. DMHC-1]|nr:dihydroorotate dehydrogenase electron transfer subunit [Magnetococcales bacterium]